MNRTNLTGAFFGTNLKVIYKILYSNQNREKELLARDYFAIVTGNILDVIYIFWDSVKYTILFIRTISPMHHCINKLIHGFN